MNAPTRLTVTSVPAATVPVGMLQIVAGTRAVRDKATGKLQEIPTDQRARAVLIPEFHIDAPSKFVALISSALGELAKKQLSDQWESNPELREVDAGSYTLDSLLLYSARKAESEKLNSTAIADWWKESSLRKTAQSRYNPAQIARLLEELENIAAPVLNPKYYNEEKALRRIVSLASDSDHPIADKMIAKLQRYVDKIRAERESIGDAIELDI